MKHILLIDDDLDFSNALKSALENRGYQVTLICNHFLKQLMDLSSSFDAVILDLNLQSISGLSLLPSIKEKEPQSSVLVLTGYASISTAVSAIKQGADQYLIQPVLVDEIIDALFNNQDQVQESSQSTGLEEKEWEYIHSVLIETDFNISKAAQKLGIHRRSLQRKIKKKGFFH